MQTECFFPCLTTFENEPFDMGKGDFKYREVVGGEFVLVCLFLILRGICGKNKPPRNRDILEMATLTNLQKEKYYFLYYISQAAFDKSYGAFSSLQLVGKLSLESVHY